MLYTNLITSVVERRALQNLVTKQELIRVYGWDPRHVWAFSVLSGATCGRRTVGVDGLWCVVIYFIVVLYDYCVHIARIYCCLDIVGVCYVGLSYVYSWMAEDAVLSYLIL